MKTLNTKVTADERVLRTLMEHAGRAGLGEPERMLSGPKYFAVWRKGNNSVCAFVTDMFPVSDMPGIDIAMGSKDDYTRGLACWNGATRLSTTVDPCEPEVLDSALRDAKAWLDMDVDTLGRFFP